jgi:cholesterol transport system auxiliary component
MRGFFIALTALTLAGCTSSYDPPEQYELTAVSHKQFAARPVKTTLLVSQPIPVMAYQSADMLYISQNYQLQPFVKNSWRVPPAEMLFPLMTQSLQNTDYFAAVIPAPTFAYADWRLDSYVIQLQQDFTHQPSIVTLELNATLINNVKASVIANKRFYVQAVAPTDNPYGGVIAANNACQQLMEELSAWVVDAARHTK